ncbi:MAG TPA: hypothetical protein VFZ47_03365 [Chitinophagaceae bacterium]
MTRTCIFLIYLILQSITLPAQSKQSESQVLWITKANGDSIKVLGQLITLQPDSALVTVYSIKNGRSKRLQQFKTLSSFPLKLKSSSFDNRKGFLLVYDPVARWGNSFLYLLDETNNTFREVKGFRELGIITPVTGSSGLFYSYMNCGCADNCWKSMLFTIKQYKIQTHAELGCNCYTLVTKNITIALPDSCDSFNDDHKFEKIDRFWKTTVKRGIKK